MGLLKSGALVGVTAILVVGVPKLSENPPQVFTDGSVSPGFEEVAQVFRKNFESGRDSLYGGSAFSAYYKGKKVVDLWGGYADADIGQQWRQDTMSIFYSTTKGIAAICFALLVDRGQLNYDKAVAHYWPEFAQKGKENITVRELLEHKAGLPLAPSPGLTPELLSDVKKAGEAMASSEPMWSPDGVTHAYHGITFGPLTNELLRRIDPEHRTMGRFFAEEIAKPFGIDFHIGLPLAENYRVSRGAIKSPNIFLHLIRGITSPTNRKAIRHFLHSDLFVRIIENSGLQQIGIFNNPYFRVVELPSAGGIGTAEAVAKLYGILAMGGTDPQTNRTLLSRQIVENLMKSDKPSLDEILGVPIAFNLGFMANEVVEGEMMYGHPGVGGQMGYADPTHQLGFAFVSTTISPFFLKDDPRTDALLAALYNCVRKQELK
ncbi:beta-lactamase domain-containing protein 2-like [Diadema setosum]|uniref:beta-lactamase domain-containing protein 2-like n=1 Tax=Diadema setosum TaxID=31175 RepID=UPI003B3A022A